MSITDSRTSIQLHLLSNSFCVQDLFNAHPTTRETICDVCCGDSLTEFCNAVYRHRAVVGEDSAPELCPRCDRRLSVARPAYRCRICFGIVLDFLCSRSPVELSELFRGTEPAIIAIEQRTVRDSAN